MYPHSFPKILFGDSRTTRDAWKRIVKAALSKNSWATIFETLEMQHVDDLHDSIIVDGKDKEFLRAESIEWRPFWVSRTTEFVASMTKGRVTDDVAVLCRALLLEGMDHFWFTVGMLDMDRGQYPRRPGRGDELPEFWWRPALEKYVRWLPELQSLSPRFTSHFESIDEYQRLSRCNWAANILNYARFGGYQMDAGLHESIHDALVCDFAGDVVEFLLSQGVVEMKHDRMHLLPLKI